jgi:acetylornithine deacetylase/succinyl-diaminopimelate desuccinylase-like protein
MARQAARISLWILLIALPCAMQVRAQSSPPQTAPASGVDFSKLDFEALGWLQGFLRINTTNPPGNELIAAKYLSDILAKEGIKAEIFESTPGRGFLVARLSSSAVPDPSRALLLMGHLDVVGVDKSKWTVDPFAAVMKDGYLYGRGAIDDKGMTIANLAVFIAMKRSGVPLNRDVIFFSEGDEENGGETGMKFAVEKHWDKIAAGFALNEGGTVVLNAGKVQYVGLQASEKVAMSVNVIATGTSGHASIPRKDNAVVHLVAAMAKIATYETPVQFDSVTRAYFGGVAALQDDETSKWIRALESPDRGEHAAHWVSSANPTWNAMMRDTISPTMLQAGIRANVIPSEARGVLNIRLLPEDVITPLLAKLGELVNDPQIRFEVQTNAGEAAPSSSLTSDLYNSIVRVSGREFPGKPVIPLMSPWATDSSPLRMRNVQAYGLLPFPLTDADVARMHAEDERIPLDSFDKGIEYLYGIVTDFAAAK